MARHIIIFILLFSSFGLFFIPADAATATTSCYGVNGLAYPNNVVCPGSNACCGTTATCLSNRLCHNEGDNNSTFVRGPCAVDPYDDKTCAQICVYNETAVSKGILPRVTVCEDGSFCCNNSPSCCGDGTGQFLNDEGLLIASPTTTTSTASSTSSSNSSFNPTSSLSTATPNESIAAASTAAATISQATAATTSSTAATKSASSGLTDAAKVGVGVGIPLALIVVGGLVAIIWIQQKRISRAKQQNYESRTASLPPYINHVQPQWVQQPSGPLTEMGTKVTNVTMISELSGR